MVRAEPGSVRLGMQSGGPRAVPAFRAAVIGSPIGHSRSPLLHAAAYRALGVDCSYTALEVDEASLPDLLARVRAELPWRGLSVTMPLKAAAARSMDSTSELASLLGVVNTVVVQGNGQDRRLVGHNTDVAGVAQALTAAGVRAPHRPVVLGGGGTAAAAVAGLAELGARTVGLVVRRPGASSGLVPLGRSLGIAVEVLEWDAAGEHVGGADVVVSTLPPRAADPLATELAARPGFHTAGTLLDVAYDPWPSALAAAWQGAGGTIVPGLDMLLQQAVEQVRLFFPEVRQERRAVLEVMYDALGAARH